MLALFASPGPYNTTLERLAPAVLAWGLGQGSMGALFLVQSLIGGFPMPPEIYGSLIYWIPAEVWSVAVLFSSALIAVGAMLQRPGMVVVGGLVGGLIYTTFYVFADQAAFGFLVRAGSITICAGMCSMCSLAGAASWVQKNGHA